MQRLRMNNKRLMDDNKAIDLLDNLDAVIDFYGKKADDANGINLAVSIAVLEVRNALARAINEDIR